MRARITTLPGDGVGPEVTAEAVRVLRAVADLHGHHFAFEERAVGGAAVRERGEPLPADTLASCLASDAVLLGAVGAPEFDGEPTERRPEAGLLALRRGLGAFANLRPVVAHDALVDCSPLRPEVVAGTDVLIVRELLGGLYFGAPRGIESGEWGSRAYNTMTYDETEVERVAHVAFRAARERRGRVASVDKANVLETSVLWRRVVSSVARQYPDVALEHVYVDAFAMHLVMSPRRFDVVLTENLFGDILSDEAAAIAGSLGLLPSASVGGRVGLFEPVHGSAPSIAGQGVANPIGAIASAALLLRHGLGLDREAADVEAAIGVALDDGHRTADVVGGSARAPLTTSEMGSRVADSVAEVVDMRHPYHAV
jgi:3-isopropylmalate dehydrogenase